MKLELDLEQDDADILRIQAESIRRIAIVRGAYEPSATAAKAAHVTDGPGISAHKVYNRRTDGSQWCAIHVDKDGHLYQPVWFETKDAALAWARGHSDWTMIVGGPSGAV